MWPECKNDSGKNGSGKNVSKVEWESEMETLSLREQKCKICRKCGAKREEEKKMKKYSEPIQRQPNISLARRTDRNSNGKQKRKNYSLCQKWKSNVEKENYELHKFSKENRQPPPSTFIFAAFGLSLLVCVCIRVLCFLLHVSRCVMEIWFCKFVITRNGLAWIVAWKKDTSANFLYVFLFLPLQFVLFFFLSVLLPLRSMMIRGELWYCFRCFAPIIDVFFLFFLTVSHEINTFFFFCIFFCLFFFSSGAHFIFANYKNIISLAFGRSCEGGLSIQVRKCNK